MARDKPDSEWCCTVLDLSWSLGASVNWVGDNDMFLQSHILLNYPYVEGIINKVIQLGPGALTYKVDISHAFWQLKVDRDDLDLLWFKLGAIIDLTDCIRFIMNK